MFKKLILAVVFSTSTISWSSFSFAGGHCNGSTMNPWC